MDFIIKPRQAGKTTELIEWMKAAPPGVARVMVCNDLREINRLQRENEDMASWQFISLGDLNNRAPLIGVTHGLRYQVELCIDNVEMLIQRMFPFHVSVVTATGGDT